MSAPFTDRNLLFGVLALQHNFISSHALLAAMHAWVMDKARSLGEILQEQGHLSLGRRQMIEGLVAEQLQEHDNDPQKSVAAMPSIHTILEELQDIADPDVQASLRQWTTPHTPVSEQPQGPLSMGESESERRRFRVLKPHARGGLGEVFLAQDEELHRQVALKEIQIQYASDPESRARFLVEAEITGGLEHPCVVPVYSLGTYGDGRPYYAMRFIKGDNLLEAIKRYHASEGVSTARNVAFRELLNRFVDVCQAIAYAHSRGILHRDLKPGNIMLGSFGETLVIDWGLAKAIGRPETVDSPLTDEATLRPSSGSGVAETRQGQVMGTAAYMSPEQAQGRIQELGPATDVYSLGATLYVLLTGRPAFSGPTAEVLRRVERGDFPRPRELKKDIPPPLEAMCLKAMALRGEDRYASAADLAADMERWLADEPVTAYRDPWSVRLGRWTRRHRTVVSGVATLLLTTVMGLSVGLVAVERERRTTAEERDAKEEARREATEERDAKEEARRAESLAREAESKARRETRLALNAMTDEVVERLMGQQVQLTEENRAFLRQVASFYEGFASDRAETEEGRSSVADGRARLGLLRHRLGELARAEEDYGLARDLRRKLVSDFPSVHQHRSDLATSHNNLGVLLNDTGRGKEAETEYRAARELQQKLVADFPSVPQHRRDLARSHNNLGNLLSDTGREKEAETEYRAARELRLKLVAEFPSVPQHRSNLALSHNNLGLLLSTMGRVKEAETEYHAARKLYVKLMSDFPSVHQHRSELGANHNSLGTLLSEMGREKEGESEFRAARELFQKLVSEFPRVPQSRGELAGTHFNLGKLLSETGREKEAEVEYRAARELRLKLVAEFPNLPQHRSVLATSHNHLGLLLSAMGRVKEAETEYHAARELYGNLVSEFPSVPRHRSDLAKSHANLSLLLIAKGRVKEAETEFRAVRKLQLKLVEEFPKVPDYRNDLAGTLVNMAILRRTLRDEAQAKQLLEEAQPHHVAVLQDNPRHPEYRQFYRNNRVVLAQVLLALGEYTRVPAVAAEVVRIGFPPDDTYNAACLAALCIPMAAKDATLREAQRRELLRSYADQAMTLLRQAVQQGYKDAAQLHKDTDLDPLRGRADFRELLDGLKGPREKLPAPTLR